jgi:hypothetical protein
MVCVLDDDPDAGWRVSGCPSYCVGVSNLDALDNALACGLEGTQQGSILDADNHSERFIMWTQYTNLSFEFGGF